MAGRIGCFPAWRAARVWLLCAAAATPAWAPAAAPLPKVRVAPGGRAFVTASGRPFIPMGVNYYRPDTGWAPQLWKQFDEEPVRRDVATMRELGVNCVRVFLSYGSFLTASNALDAAGLERFDRFLALAEAAGIYVHPTGPDHWEGVPEWARGDRLADERIAAATVTFWRLFAARYRGRAVIFAYDLLNEPEIAWDSPAVLARRGRPAPPPEDQPLDPELLAHQRFREDVADMWTRRQVEAIKASDAEALVTVGLIQWSVPALLPGVRHYSGFRPERQAKYLDFLEVHFYPLDSRTPGADDEVRNLAYLESVVGAVAAAGKPIIVAEFGWNRAGEEQQARWCRRAVELTAGLACGWLNWGLYDVDQARDGSAFTGLLTSAGRPKAWAGEFRRLAQTLSLPAPRERVRPPLDWDRAITSPAAGHAYREAYLRAFLADPHGGSSGRPPTQGMQEN